MGHQSGFAAGHLQDGLLHHCNCGHIKGDCILGPRQTQFPFERATGGERVSDSSRFHPGRPQLIQQIRREDTRKTRGVRKSGRRSPNGFRSNFGSIGIDSIDFRTVQLRKVKKAISVGDIVPLFLLFIPH